jgi:lipoprotein-anchoring transpeptidase ErfK/SrfK
VQTLKTAIVVVLLLVVFYGVYEMLNRPPAEAPPAVAELTPDATADLQIDFGEISTGTSTEPPPASFDPNFGAPSTEPDVSIPAPTVEYPSQETPENEDVSSQPPGGAFSPPAIPATTPPDRGSPPPPVTSPRADSLVMPVPGGGQVLQNPFIHEDAAPKRTLRQNLGSQAYQRALARAQSGIAEGDYRTALGELSVFYKSQDLTADEQRQLLDLLDPLAGRVIYSREHLLEQPYTVRRNETLMDIAQQYNVPYQLLQKINGIENPNVLLPGSELKVVSGPFRADVDLESQELTVFLDRYYAGRFPITLGIDPQPIEGDFQVREKRPGKTYFSMDGRTIPAESPANPFGAVWLDLGREVCIHGSPIGGGEQKRGCISLSPRDANDVYSILSVGSKIRILR